MTRLSLAIAVGLFVWQWLMFRHECRLLSRGIMRLQSHRKD